MEHPIPLSEAPPQVARICAPETPLPMKMMAASGVAPLPPAELIWALYFLSYSQEPAIATAVKKTLSQMPDPVLFGALVQVQSGAVLDGLARVLSGRPDAIERIVLSRITPDETFAYLAGHAHEDRILEIVAANEERLLRHPPIIEALYFNKCARMSTVDRAVELAIRNGLELAGIPSFAEIKAAIEGELILEPEDEPTPDDVAFLENVEHDELKDTDHELVTQVLEAKEQGGEPPADVAAKVEKTEQSISRMNVSQRIRLATLGSANQRAVLSRDSNKLVIMAVVKSPALTDSEIMRYSNFRSLPEEAVRYMARNREWTKHYQVKLNLVHNPRTPTEFSMRFLTHLRDADIRTLERDRNVPQNIATAARELRQKRGK